MLIPIPMKAAVQAFERSMFFIDLRAQRMTETASALATARNLADVAAVQTRHAFAMIEDYAALLNPPAPPSAPGPEALDEAVEVVSEPEAAFKNAA